MAEQWQVSDVVEFQVGETPCWQVVLQRPDGNLVNHVMPKSIFDHKAAELGIDPTDLDELLDIVLHDPWVPVIDDPITGNRRYADEGVEILTAESTTQARQAHKARLKNSAIKIQVKGNKSLDKLRQKHKPNPDLVREVAEKIDIRRWEKRYGKLPNQAVDLERKGAAQRMGQALGITVTLPDLRRE